MPGKYLTNSESNFLTHRSDEYSFDEVVENAKKRIRRLGNKDGVTVEERLNILQQLTEFPYGTFFLINGGLNGYWTRYMNLYPKYKSQYNLTHPLEKMILERMSSMTGSQERYDIFQRLLQQHITNGMKICCVPCGYMDVLLTLDYSKKPDVKLVGIDIDPDSTIGAETNAKVLHLDHMCTFHTMDAWKMNFKNEFDIFVSNMLVQYAKDEKAIVEFYRIAYNSLKENGILIISCLLPLYCADKNLLDHEAERVCGAMIDVVGAKWINFQTREKMTADLENVGFKSVETHFDKVKRFPTLLARK